MLFTEENLFCGDCLEVMSTFKSKSIDMILTDPPYGTTACKWDFVIPIEPMWEQLKRIIKPNGAIVLFGTEPFSSLLRISNLTQFKYDWVWQKDKVTNHLNAKRMPMRRNEIISVFYKEQCLYKPQLIKKDSKNIKPLSVVKRKQVDHYGTMTAKSIREIPIDMSYPNETLQFKGCFSDRRKVHPTQKPVALMEYLIKTYSKEGEIILDFAMGSGTTGVACVNTNRNFIGIELDKNYFELAKEEIFYPV